MGLFSKDPAFQASTFKANLKMAVGRSKIQKNKFSAKTKELQRAAALCLKEGAESRARIKAEQIIQVGVLVYSWRSLWARDTTGSRVAMNPQLFVGISSWTDRSSRWLEWILYHESFFRK